MGDRGRTPASELKVVDSGIVASKRPAPPEGLTPEQKDTWISIVNRLPADWFPAETHPILEQYCRHVSAAKIVAWQIAAMGLPENVDSGEESGFDLSALEDLFKMQERESRAMTALARSMRITQQATYDPKKTKGKGGQRPWEAQG